MSDNGAVSFAEIAGKREHRDVEVPEFGGTVRLVGLTAKERSSIELKYAGKGGDIDPFEFRCDVLRPALQEWAPGTPVEDIMELPAKGVERLFEAALELSGFSNKDIEELEGN